MLRREFVSSTYCAIVIQEMQQNQRHLGHLKSKYYIVIGEKMILKIGKPLRSSPWEDPIASPWSAKCHNTAKNKYKRKHKFIDQLEMGLRAESHQSVPSGSAARTIEGKTLANRFCPSAIDENSRSPPPLHAAMSSATKKVKEKGTGTERKMEAGGDGTRIRL